MEMEKEFEEETHEIFRAISSRIDEITISVRDGKYDHATAIAFMIGLLQDIDKVVVEIKNERKNKRTTEKN